MSQIRIDNLSFGYDGSLVNVFDNVSFTIDTNWKLGLTGRNGRGKTTLLKLLMGEYPYEGHIQSDALFDYFPYDIQNEADLCIDIMHQISPSGLEWQFQKELSLIEMDNELLYRPYATLSGGEKTRLQLAALFINKTHFLLIDEPTNHLDIKAREMLANYLNKKQGFLLVSHDRTFLDHCVDHMMSLDRNGITIEKGNFSSWYENQKRQENFELVQNERLKKEMKRLSSASRQAQQWSHKTESSKFGEAVPDRGFIGARAARMMQRSKNTKRRHDKAYQEKEKLLKNVEMTSTLKIMGKPYHQNELISANHFAAKYNDIHVFKPISFAICRGDRIALTGQNGSGKSTLLKCLLGENIAYDSELYKGSQLKISYVSQDTQHLIGTLSIFAQQKGIDLTQFQTILRKMGFERDQFENNIENFSAGQKKKVLIASSLCENAHLYLWDEPLNYIDVLSRIQIEELLITHNPTMLFVEHDAQFIKNVATKELRLIKN